MGNIDVFEPPLDDEPVEPTPSPVKRALNVSGRNLPFFNNCVEAAPRAQEETANQGNAADPAEATQRQNKPDKALKQQQSAETSWDDL